MYVYVNAICVEIAASSIDQRNIEGNEIRDHTVNCGRRGGRLLWSFNTNLLIL